MIKENGNAAIMRAFCSASNPPVDNKIIAIADCEIPQVSLTIFGGYNEPNDVCIPSTNVAESADVMKNTLTSKMAMIDKIIDNGSSLNTANNVSSVNKPVKSVPFICTSIAVAPNAENQKKLIIDGSNSTPIKNSQIVRPRDTRAINTPTNGDQEIHHAQ